MTGAPGMRTRLLARVLHAKLARGTAFDSLPAPEILNTPGICECRPALFEPDQLERVRACGFRRSIYDEVAKLTATRFLEGPLERYRLGPAVIAGGWILTRERTLYFGARSPLKALGGPLRELDRAEIVSSEQGVKYFGHWLRDDCPLYDWIRNRVQPFALTRPNWPDRHLYEAAFDQRWETLDFARIGDLTVYRDLSFHHEKDQRIRQLRQKLRAAHPGRPGGQIVYLTRGQMGSPRTMSNAAAFEAAMQAAGIRVVTPGSDPARLLDDLLDARMIITIEGSQAAHGVYMLAEGGAMLVLQPPERFYNPHHEWLRLLGMRYGTVIGTKDETSFHVDPDEVLRMVDRIEAAE
ncbi:glycosyltransferase 61 family protein [Rhodovulum sp.]|uniref:glycosyltransferase 61 family protein n=1 Tax=Rhodovulum sp. TaxID=34009 RepID=UPI00257E9B16|nr:glycosyltransferase 61 family protein [Rhodovulum sp.]